MTHVDVERPLLFSSKGRVGWDPLYMLKALSEVSMAYSLFVWTARVPSASNPSDAPSRGKYDHLVSEGFQALNVSWPKADRF